MGSPVFRLMRRLGGGIASTAIGALLVMTSPSGSLLAACLHPYRSPPGPAKKEDVYKGLPFQAGELATYAISYMGVKVGYGSLEVNEPSFYLGAWHRVFSGNASTGDWYKAIFVAKDFIKAHSRASDFAISWFRISQDEGSLFGKRLRQDKVLEFKHSDCTVRESMKNYAEPLLVSEHELEAGAVDALGASYKLRLADYKLGKVERMLIYTSEKNWWLDALPVGFETLRVPAGTFETVKLKLTTYLGKDLQQRGDVHLWIATTRPERPMVRLAGQIKIGSVDMVLESFRPGTP